jgi:hypothetical protein
MTSQHLLILNPTVVITTFVLEIVLKGKEREVAGYEMFLTCLRLSITSQN